MQFINQPKKLSISAATEPKVDVEQLFGPWSLAELLERVDFIAEDKKQGLIFVGGVIAKKCHKVDPTLGYYKDKFEPDQQLRESPWFIDGMNRGGLKYPIEQFFQSLKLMNHLFEQYHPSGQLRRGTVQHFYLNLNRKCFENQFRLELRSFK